MQKNELTGRERVLAAVRGKPVDRIAARFNAAAAEAEVMAKYLNIPLTGEWLIPLHQRLRVDMLKVEPWIDNKHEPLNFPETGAIWEEFEKVSELDPRWAEVWRNPDNFNFDHVLPSLELWDASGNPPALQLSLGAIYGPARQMRGDARAMMDLMDDHEVMIYIMDVRERWISGIIKKAKQTFGDRVDIYYFGEELGMQTGLMYSPESIRTHFFPRFKRLAEQIHAQGGILFFHSCGAIDPLIPELIELGVDILNPIQPGLPGMAPESLGAKYGGKLSFCGGLNMQNLMPFGTPAEIQAEVQRYIKCFGSRYILDYANILHPDVPPENSLAMYDAPRILPETT